MILTQKQEEGLKIAVQRHRANEKYTVISGYAGSGKSTLVRFIIDALDVEEDKVCYCAFTGKAAEILRKKGNKNVCTLHKLLFEHIPRAAGGFIRVPKTNIPYDIVVVDDVSMAPKILMDLLFSHNVYVICLGDPGQLPPINKDEDNMLLNCPHIFLNEIMRQAQESEIIQLTMKIRNKEPIEYFKGNEVMILPYTELNTGVLTWGDQVLTATNTKRRAINEKMRLIKGIEGPPQDGDKIICLRNYWDDCSENGDALVNGTIGILNNSFTTKRYLPHFIANKFNTTYFDILAGTVIIPNAIENTKIEDIYENIEIDYKMMLTGEKCCDWRLSYQLGKLKKSYGEIVPKEFDYAYAITCHKAQGSEWNKVVVLEEQFPYNTDEHARWLYTACTRASEKLVLVR
jgi:exodeoxyribonuclease-5